VQGRSEAQAESLRRQARTLEDLGCFAIVLECVSEHVAADITAALTIPTIGIGAGSATDGQVLVLQDLWGINHDHAARFVRRYLDGDCLLQQALDRYDADVKGHQFPGLEETYS
jgi:3-methyl-2-oxobutanoate hydroxymethyltransferase